MSLIEVKQNFSRRELLWFGPVVGLFGAVVGAMLTFRFDMPSVACAVAALTSVLLLIYYGTPSWRIPIYRGWIYLFLPLGWLMSHLLLAVIFYTIFAPIGLAMRIVGYDPMKRSFDKKAASYWSPRGEVENTDRYFKQF